MTRSIADMIQSLTLNEGSPIADVHKTFATLGIAPPDDYARFLISANGGEGAVGRSGYVVLWRSDQLIGLNEAYHVSEFAPSLVLFGSDGGDTAYAFDRRHQGRIVSVPFVGMRDDAVVSLGDSFSAFLESIGE